LGLTAGKRNLTIIRPQNR